MLATQAWSTNADLIADVARLGYLDGTVLGATYGEGGFWTRWKPAGDNLVTNDLYKRADHAEDYRSLPFAAGMFAVVVFDPPYKLSGTPALGAFDERYGIERPMSRVERLEDIRLGALECFRVANRWLLVKCMDQVEGGQVRWQTDLADPGDRGCRWPQGRPVRSCRDVSPAAWRSTPAHGPAQLVDAARVRKDAGVTIHALPTSG